VVIGHDVTVLIHNDSRADAHALARAHLGLLAERAAKEELEEISKQVEDLKRQLQKTTQRLKKALR
jgi:hypothetical protein